MGFMPRFILGVFIIILSSCHTINAVSSWRHIRQAHPPEEISSIEDVEVADQLPKTLEKNNFIFNDSLTTTTPVVDRKPKTENISTRVNDVKTEDIISEEKEELEGGHLRPTPIVKTEKITVKETDNNSDSSQNISDSNRNVNARAIDVDISKYLSEEFHNKNNIYTLTVSPDTEKYTNNENEWSSTFHQEKSVLELTTKSNYDFDKTFKSIENSVKQKLEYIDDDLSSAHDDSTKSSRDNFDQSTLTNHDNSTNVNLDYSRYKNVTSNKVKIKNKIHQDIEINSGRNILYNSSYTTTETYNESHDSKNNVPTESDNNVRNYDAPTTSKKDNQIDFSNNRPQEDSRHRKFQTKNESSVEKSIISNKIETDAPTADDKLKRRVQYTTVKPAVSKENAIIPLLFNNTNANISRRGSTKYYDTLTTTERQNLKEEAASQPVSTSKQHSEQFVQENQVYHVQIPAPNKNKLIASNGSDDSYTTAEYFTLTTASTTATSAQKSTLMISTLFEETTTATQNVDTNENKFNASETDLPSSTVYETTSTTDNFGDETSTVSEYSTEDILSTTTTLPDTTTVNSKIPIVMTTDSSDTLSVTSDTNYQSDQTSSAIFDSTTEVTITNFKIELTTTPESNTEVEDFTTVKLDTTTQYIAETSKLDESAASNNVVRNFTEDSTRHEISSKNILNVSYETNGRSYTPSSTHRIIKPETTSEDMPLIISLNTSIVDIATPDSVTTEDTDFNTESLGTKEESNGGKIAAIIISSVGAVCLIALAILLFIMRKRHKRFNYGQRCTPVSLDAYSVDNVSVYNSVRRKAAARASKRSYGNPAFDDPAMTTNPLNFPTLAKFASNNEAINKEFEEIPQINVQTSELPEGCEVKNRYANVIPLPETRVFLSSIDSNSNSDYINANYVTGPKGSKKYYIACQAPIQNTVDDFWKMIWEQQSKVILMLTHLFENGIEKCVDYLPPSEVLDCHRSFGDFHITLKKREVKEKYIISNLHLKNMVSNSWREVTHLWYLGWPEKGVPLEANSIIAFLIEARSYIKPISSSENGMTGHTSSNDRSVNGSYAMHQGPVVVHCSPGTGRTGTVIACDIAIREFELARQVDIPRTVYRIRRDRASSVQTKEQYSFIYQVITLYATKLTGGVLDSL